MNDDEDADFDEIAAYIEANLMRYTDLAEDLVPVYSSGFTGDEELLAEIERDLWEMSGLDGENLYDMEGGAY